MKLAIFIFALFYIALFSAASAADLSANATDTNNTTYIFLQEGMNGSFIKDASGNYTLTISGVVPYTVFFSDRPARDAGFIEMNRFIEGFGFDLINPPNALIMIEDESEDNDAIVVELTVPQYDKTNSTLTYTARVIDDYTFESEWPRDLLSRVDKAIPEQFGRVAIVIDNKVKLSCSDSNAYCGNENKVCGSVSTGCCWSWSATQCEACHSFDTYDSECKAKYGNDCGYLNENHCYA